MYATSARRSGSEMIPPQCGMLTIGCRPSTLPLRMKSMIFASVLNSLKKSAPESGGIVLPETVDSARGSCLVADVEPDRRERRSERERGKQRDCRDDLCTASVRTGTALLHR